MTVLSALLQITIYSAVIFAAVKLFKILFKKFSSPLLQYLVWFILIARLLIPVTLDAGFSFFTMPTQQIQAASGDLNAADSYIENTVFPAENKPVSYPMTASSQTVLEPSQTQNDVSVLTSADKTSFKFDWISVLILAWVAGTAVSMARIARAFRRLNRLIHKSSSASSRLHALAERIKSELHLHSDVRIAVVDEALSPALSAGLRPVVIIPRGMLRMDEEQMEFALRHELMHLKRKDYLVCLLLVFLRAVYWFNPVVQLAARQMKTDMEPSCDSAVVAYMDGDKKKRYINTILNMYTGNKPQFVLGMALEGSARKTAESRIRGIFMPPRSKHGTKAAAVLLTCVLLVACFTTSCQPTPEKPVVVNKNEGALTQAIQATPAPTAAYDAPQTYQKTFAAKDDRVTVNINVDVMIPDAAQFPVVQIQADEFTVDFVKKAAAILFEGNTAYEPRTELTKAEIQNEILKLQQALADPENSTSDGLRSGDPDTVAMVTEMFKDRIRNYQALLETAPDDYAPKESDFQFQPVKYYEDPAMYKENSDMWTESGDEQSVGLLDWYENGRKLVLDATLADGYYGRIDVLNFSGTGYRSNMFSFTKGDTLRPYNRPGPYSDQIPEYPPSGITQDEAARMGAGLLDRLGIEDMAVISCAPLYTTGSNLPTESQPDEVAGYDILFQRTFGGVQSIDDTRNAARLSYDDRYGQFYPVESIQITILNDQITAFRWTNPSGQAETENGNIRLKPFDEIIEAFERQMSLEYTLEKLSRYAPENPDYDAFIADMQSGEINISKIQLGMVRLAVQDRPGLYRMVPAWKFYGTEKVVQNDQETERSSINYLIGETSIVYQSINAVDGSVIDTNLGY